MKAMLNITWRCNLDSCPYCWVRQALPDRNSSQDKPWQQWAEALLSQPRISHVDFVGGEPLIFENLLDLIKAIAPVKTWALTTNLVSDNWQVLVNSTLPNCQCITCSWHPSNGKIDLLEFASRVDNLAKKYPTSINILETADHAYKHKAKLIEAGFRDNVINISPYEDVSRAGPMLDRILECNAGISHCVIAANGDVFPCLSLFRRNDRDRFCLGNIWDRISWPMRRYRCASYCYDYDVLYSRHQVYDMWNLQIEETK